MAYTFNMVLNTPLRFIGEYVIQNQKPLNEHLQTNRKN